MVDIKADVLRVISLGINSPTRIMFASNISWDLLNKILKDLCRKGLIEEVGSGRRKKFKITGKGVEILMKYREVQRALE